MNRRDFALRTPAALAGIATGLAALPAARAAESLNLAPQIAYQLAAQGHGFSVGPMMSANPAYVFFDTTCPHCAHLWDSAQPLLRKLKMVWLPVGFLRRISLPQGATILAAPNPVAAMKENESRVRGGKPGIEVDPKLSDAAIEQVKANTALFDKLGASSVPLMLYRHAKNGTHGVHSGAAETPLLVEMLGL